VTAWLDPVRVALDQRTTPCLVFWRDDDAGWDDGALWALLDEFEGAGVPIDVAAIPTAITPSCGRVLGSWMVGGLVRVHQHGYAHENHETIGRKCEFGPSRPPAALAADITAGRARLEDAIGPTDPVFTPPWNRCVDATADAALAAGHRVLSRDVSAGCIGAAGLAEVPVTIDWFARRKGVRLTPPELGQRIATAIADGAPSGLMLHHAVMDDTERSAVRALLELLAASPATNCSTILGVAEASAAASSSRLVCRPREPYDVLARIDRGDARSVGTAARAMPGSGGRRMRTES
jgi:hypothetical protein